MTVVATGELQHAVAPREGPREPNGAHGGFGPGRHEAHHLERRNGVDELLGQLDLPLRRRAECGPLGRGFPDSVHDLGIGVAEDEWTPRHHPIDVAASLDVLDVRTLGAANEERLVDADRPHRTHG
jgi:hypothetical protein